MIPDSFNGSSATSVFDLRAKPRMPVDFWAIVRGVGADGRKFQEETRITNLSASGLYLQVGQRVKAEKPLFVLFRFAASPDVPALQVAAHGTVRHATVQDDGSVGVGLMFKHYRMAAGGV
jgi:hypothetical protein